MFQSDFLILNQTMHGLPLVYLDNANTTQKPECVIQAMDEYYHQHNANIHRAVYLLSERATALFESAREKIQHFIHAQHRHEIIFTKGTTESINLVADSLSRMYFKAGDEIIISAMEHHSNIVPWQMACEKTGAQLKVVPVDDSGCLDMEVYQQLLNDRTALVAITHVSNVLGTINPIQAIIAHAHQRDIPVLLDGAQALTCIPVDVQALDCDFYAFSSHKMYGPMGTGVLYGKEKWLEKMLPYQGGGSMIQEVSFEKTTYAALPYKFEAGTQNVAGVIGLGAAIDYLNKVGIHTIHAHEQRLLQLATAQLSAIEGLGQ